MSLPTIALVSDISNDDRKEDLFLMRALQNKYNVLMLDLKSLHTIEDVVDIVLFKCAWPNIKTLEELKAYGKLSLMVQKRLKEKNITTFNNLSGRADILGKDYLFELFKKGYPVIPSVCSLDKIGTLDDCSDFFIKPFDGLSSFGAKKICKSKIKKELNNFKLIIQPFIVFKYEVSFYFLDNEFQYSLYAPNPKKRWDLKKYHPTKKDLLFAQQFIDWNTMKYGVQRVDACRTYKGDLLLMELEDDYPLWSFLDLSNKDRDCFINKFLKSLEKNCFNI